MQPPGGFCRLFWADMILCMEIRISGSPSGVTGEEHCSHDGKYRYLYRKRISDSARCLLFIMLNPATPDGEQSKRQTRGFCEDFAEYRGFGMLETANLFAFRARRRAELRRALDPVGPENDRSIRDAVGRADMVVLAWGNPPSKYSNRAEEIRKMVLKMTQPYHLGLNETGEPRHPRGVSKEVTPIPYER